MIRMLGLMAIATLLASAPAGVHASLITYVATLNGSSESPPNTSPGFGTVRADYDNNAHTLRLVASFGNLTGGTTAAHIHAATPSPGSGTAGIATMTPTFVGFPLGVTSGTYDQTFDTLSSAFYNPAYLTANGGTAAGAETALLSAMNSGQAYFNIHTTNFPGGEIRGFFAPASVPEPSSVSMLVAGLLGIAARAGHRRRARGKAAWADVAA